MKHGHPEMVVVRRELDTGTAVLSVGDRYPVDASDKRELRRRDQYYDQRRIDVDPAWLAANVPGAARRLGIAPKPKSKKGR